ncbi:hypothetical protein M9H77_13513 [Catharanthus roseus]|uniref:Uncharacterized protein n=1 Tax=Catharanthus roseus TaxID=4058 RepID=A0ACC0BKP6_CATRO|nr:hypothetical protein M9H77_13513 [Catharanthus roseus]
MGANILLKKKLSLILFLLISASLFSSSFAGRQYSNFARKSEKKVVEPTHEGDMVSEIIHERLLKANTRDYGRYDPAPALVKPPFKLIPN